MKAIGLLSGGLDSSLAVKIIIDQGIDVEALKFTSPFCNCDQGGHCFSASMADDLGIKLTNIPKGQEFLDIIANPRHGYGSGMNPCIDCRIFMLKKAGEYADACGAAFVFTGEVLGQRPMSQHRDALRLIEKESGLQGKLLRPLSAKHLPETEAEKNGVVDRKRLLSITGRGRKELMSLADFYGIKGYACPAGGCLLTDKHFASRLKDHLAQKGSLNAHDVMLLKKGRHFRFGELRFILGRNETENNFLKKIFRKDQTLLEPVNVNGPTGLICGNIPGRDVLDVISSIFASYCDGVSPDVDIRITVNDTPKIISGVRAERSLFADLAV
jgi:tRNA U34 2-thiouridine synthase MnmA/TrmU